jgi:hypothetical protein
MLARVEVDRRRMTVLPARRRVVLFTSAVACGVLALCAAPAIGGDHASSRATVVGRWSRTVTCRQVVAALAAAGLRPVAPAILQGNGFVPGTVQQLAAKRDICSGATPREHSHFFTSDGRFGSVDWRGRQVDDGHYTSVGTSTIKIGDASFRYSITARGLALAPQITARSKRAALARPLVFSTAGWMIAVALPGGTWKRVPCNQWC